MSQRIQVKELSLDEKQKDILIGHLLGDGCLYPLPNSEKASLKVEQSLKQKEFVDWLFKIFYDFIRTPPKEKHYICSTSKGVFQKNSIYFNTLSFKLFYSFYKMFYQNKKKVIPDNIEQLLTPLSFTVWFMGDGSVKSKECNGRILNTHGFTSSEIEKLVQILNLKFSLKASIRRQKDGLQIYISAKSAENLHKLVSPHLLPSFRYKLPNLKINKIAKIVTEECKGPLIP